MAHIYPDTSQFANECGLLLYIPSIQYPIMYPLNIVSAKLDIYLSHHPIEHVHIGGTQLATQLATQHVHSHVFLATRGRFIAFLLGLLGLLRSIQNWPAATCHHRRPWCNGGVYSWLQVVQ